MSIGAGGVASATAGVATVLAGVPVGGAGGVVRPAGPRAGAGVTPCATVLPRAACAPREGGEGAGAIIGADASVSGVSGGDSSESPSLDSVLALATLASCTLGCAAGLA